MLLHDHEVKMRKGEKMLNFFWIIPYMIFMLLAVLISLAYSILMYVLNGMGVSRMAKSLGVSNPNGAFVPFYRMKILGDVAEESAVRNNGKRRSYGNILMWLYIGFTAAIMLFVILFGVAGVILSIAEGSTGNSSVEISTIGPISMLGFSVLFYIGIMAMAIIYCVYFYMALYQIYKCFSPDLAVVWLLLSIFVQPAQPILMLVLSKSTPAPSPYSYTGV